jgi:tetratricopeptide (TPR) repeat protein
LRVHFINLDRSKDRLAEFEHINSHLTEPIRYPAVDGQTLDIASLAARGLVTEDILKNYVISSVGHAISNLALWDIAIQTGKQVTICEDDAIFNQQFEFHAEQLINILPPNWDLVVWGWNFDSIFYFEMLPGIVKCQAWFDQGRMILNTTAFQHEHLSPGVFKLLWAWGTPCYTVSPKGARTLKSKLLPFRPMSTFRPDGRPGPPIVVVGIDGALNDLYRHIDSFACFPPLAITKNERTRSTIQPTKSSPVQFRHDTQTPTINADTIAPVDSSGLDLLKLKGLEEALVQCDRALALKPDDVAALSNRGDVLIDLDRFEEALSSYNKLLSIQSKDFTALNMRGLVLEQLRRPEEALADYEKAIALVPDAFEAHYNRGNVLADLARFEEALASYEKALEIKTDAAPIFNNRGLVLEQLGRLKEALASYETALKLRPDYPAAGENRRMLLEELDRSRLSSTTK